jgi:uncharacterized protein (TIGR02231 family)
MKGRLLLTLSVALAGHAASAATPAGPPEADAAKPVVSKIAEVTVYADRAQVTRTASIPLSTEPVQFAFAKLPGWLDEGSVRVGLSPAESGQIIDVQVKRNYLARATDQEFVKAQAAVQEIADQIVALDDEKKVLEAQETQVQSIRAFSLEKLPKDTAIREVKVGEYGAVVDFIETALRKLSVSRRDLEHKRRELQPELEARQRQLNELQGRSQLQQSTVIVTAKGAAARPATVALTYLLPGATWEPVHDLRARAEAKTVTLSSYAHVIQTTGEDWEGAALSLSTQRPTETTRIPELEALLMGQGRGIPQLLAPPGETFQRAQQNYTDNNGLWFSYTAPAIRHEVISNLDFQAACQARAEKIFQTLQQRGTTAHFKALGIQTVRSDGRPVRVPIGTIELEAAQKLIAAPELNLNAIRTVDLVNQGKQPLLPGRVSLFLEGAFLGATETAFVAQGEAFSLYLGVADQIKLSRTLDRKNSELSRWGNGTRMQVAFVITAENLSDSEVSLQLADRVPVAEGDEVRVKNVRITPEIKPDGKGLLRWDVVLPPRQARQFRIEYAVEYPSDLPKKNEAEGAAPSDLRDQIRKLESKF